MEIQGLQALYAGHKSVKALAKGFAGRFRADDFRGRTVRVGRSFAVQQFGCDLSAGDGLSVCFRIG